MGNKPAWTLAVLLTLAAAAPYARAQPGSPRPRAERRAPGRREVNARQLAVIRQCLADGLPAAAARGLRVLERDGRAVVRGTARSQAERDAVVRLVFEVVTPEQAVIELEVKSEGGP